MKFLWTTILTNDMEETLKFYQEVVGLKIDRRFHSGDSMEICFLGEGETKLEVIHNEKIKNIDPGNSVTLGFKVNSLDEKIEFLKEKGIKIKTGPIQTNSNLKYLIVQDPNGVKVQFAELSSS